MMEDYPFEFNEDNLEMVAKHIASISVEKEIDPIYWREPIDWFISVLRSQAHAANQGENFGLMIEELAKNICPLIQYQVEISSNGTFRRRRYRYL